MRWQRQLWDIFRPNLKLQIRDQVTKMPRYNALMRGHPHMWSYEVMRLWNDSATDGCLHTSLLHICATFVSSSSGALGLKAVTRIVQAKDANVNHLHFLKVRATNTNATNGWHVFLWLTSFQQSWSSTLNCGLTTFHSSTPVVSKLYCHLVQQSQVHSKRHVSSGFN